MSESNDTISIALVGHCTPDAFALKSAIAGFFPGASVDTIGSRADFEQRIGDFRVHLVNRVLDGDFPDTSGIELIREHAGSHPGLMLISNFPESLQEASEAGGLHGFGKRDMRGESAREAINNALSLSAGESGGD